MVPPSEQTSSSAAAKKKNNKNGKKRKIGNNSSNNKQSKIQQHEVEKSEKFSRLEYFASKSIRKEGKVVKAFECRKIAKKPSNPKNNTNPQLTLSLEDAKAFDLELLVKVCLKRLGISEQQKIILNSTNRKGENDDIENNDASVNLNDNISTKQASALEMSFMEKILQHKKIVTVLETLAEKVLEFIQWDKQRQTWINEKRFENNDNNDRNHPNKIKRKKNTNRNDENDTNVSALFVDSLSGAIAEDHENDYYNDGDECMEGFDLPKKKNRKGQRARKAKALAIEAKKAGKVQDSSINWRPKKANKDKKDDSSNTNSSSASGLRKNTETKIADVAKMGTSWKEKGKAHPSWAAREAQKEKSGIGIVQFTGKKITFD